MATRMETTPPTRPPLEQLARASPSFPDALAGSSVTRLIHQPAVALEQIRTEVCAFDTTDDPAPPRLLHAACPSPRTSRGTSYGSRGPWRARPWCHGTSTSRPAALHGRPQAGPIRRPASGLAPGRPRQPRCSIAFALNRPPARPCRFRPTWRPSPRGSVQPSAPRIGSRVSRPCLTVLSAAAISLYGSARWCPFTFGMDGSAPSMPSPAGLLSM